MKRGQGSPGAAPQPNYASVVRWFGGSVVRWFMATSRKVALALLPEECQKSARKRKIGCWASYVTITRSVTRSFGPIGSSVLCRRSTVQARKGTRFWVIDDTGFLKQGRDSQ
ncbi:MAG: hypothetical protein BWY17_01605 [Deltaproteobacteria bacterium ADurb.Bin207]|jgi:hypothetical protein|nr:MAG: hypothetical protein BWY17_01605 [Deltaproteobacteria bacterium ADurb.Bin207]